MTLLVNGEKNNSHCFDESQFLTLVIIKQHKQKELLHPAKSDRLKKVKKQMTSTKSY